MKLRERHAWLCAEIARHDHRYYVLDAPVIGDRQYDALFLELKQLERAHPELVHPGSPTQRIGERPREGARKVSHVQAMFSLDNTYNEAELREFDRRVRDGLGGDPVTYVAEPKLDGASLEVVYEDGALRLGITRGDGKVGEDVTPNVRTIRSVPLVIAEKRSMTLRGEVVIYRRDLDRINQARAELGEEPFANPRNAASGWLRLLDPRQSAERPLRLFVYELCERYHDTHHESLATLARLGLPTHGLERTCGDLDQVFAYIEELDKKRHKLPYETDGVVIKVDSFTQREQLGVTSRFPRWAIAYKYEAERAFTRVLAIETDLGRTGALTPVAVLEPVPLSGTVVSRASLHNVDYVAEKDVRVGDMVRVEKAGEIIPQVLSVDLAQRPASATPWVAPTRCPACDSEVSRAEDAAALRCPNPHCKGRLKAGIFHFTRRTAMDVDRLGIALIEQLVDHGLLHDVADIFTLPTRREALMSLPRMAKKSLENLLVSIDEARTGRTLSRLLGGLGIPLVGSVAASVIAQRYRGLQTLLDLDPSRLREELGEIHGIGPKIADSMATFFADVRNREMLSRLIALGVRAEEPEPEAVVHGPLSGSSLCVTGVMSAPREQIHALIRGAGGEVHERVGKNTTYLVAGDKVGETKLEAARRRGTKILSEDGLRALIGEG
jgi:DNA ligase (NAD+)